MELCDGWSLVSPLNLSVSPQTLATEQLFGDAANDVRTHLAEHGALFYHKLRWSKYPHIVLREGDTTWTSVHLGLVPQH